MTMAKGKKLIAETKLIKDGRRNCFYEVDVRDELGTKVAVVMINGVHLG
jgi:acyl-CoA thioesterase